MLKPVRVDHGARHSPRPADNAHRNQGRRSRDPLQRGTDITGTLRTQTSPSPWAHRELDEEEHPVSDDRRGDAGSRGTSPRPSHELPEVPHPGVEAPGREGRTRPALPRLRAPVLLQRRGARHRGLHHLPAHLRGGGEDGCPRVPVPRAQRHRVPGPRRRAERPDRDVPHTEAARAEGPASASDGGTQVKASFVRRPSDVSRPVGVVRTVFPGPNFVQSRVWRAAIPSTTRAARFYCNSTIQDRERVSFQGVHKFGPEDISRITQRYLPPLAAMLWEEVSDSLAPLA